MNTTNQIVKIGFHGSELEAVKQGDDVFVSVRRVCEELGIQPHGQVEKLKEKAWARTQLICARDTAGRTQEAFMIDLKSFPLWLAGIEASRVAEDVREMLVKYQREAADVLYGHFFGRAKASANEERLSRREERLARKQKSDGYRIAINLARAACPAMVRRYEAKQAAVLAGEDFDELYHNHSTATWRSAEDIAAECDVTSNRIGLVISSLWGRGRDNIDGIREVRLGPAKHSDKIVPTSFYSPGAVEQIKEQLEGLPRLVEGDSAGEGAPQC